MKKDEKKRWYAVQSGSRKEKFVVDLLHRKGITSYLPLVKRTKRYASRIKSYDVPLISCYVFVHITPEERVPVLETEYIYQFIRFRNQDAEIPQHEIDTLKYVVGNFDNVEVVDKQPFRPGEEVELMAGELTGIKGTIIEERGSKKYLISLENMDIQLTWTVEASKLKRST